MSNSRVRKHFSNGRGKPACGRQLSRPGATITNQANMQITEELTEVKCRHCLRAIGLLPKLQRVVLREEDSEDTDHYADGRQDAEAEMEDMENADVD